MFKYDPSSYFFSRFLQSSVKSSFHVHSFTMHIYARLASWKIHEIQKVIVITFPMLIWSPFYLVSFRYSMQIRVNGKRPKSDEKLTHFLLERSLRVFLHPSFHQSVHPSIRLPNRIFLTPSVYQRAHQSKSPSVSPFVHPSITHSSNSSKITGIFNHATLPVLYEGALSG